MSIESILNSLHIKRQSIFGKVIGDTDYWKDGIVKVISDPDNRDLVTRTMKLDFSEENYHNLSADENILALEAEFLKINPNWILDSYNFDVLTIVLSSPTVKNYFK